ncbi:endo-alpha-N-acetylgalactosaminidase family protein [Agromyces laixinhei]|uniref:endo-alpha-N-acetylgalactosaminidase family protein n=1 Tax=Agromyces laixinhei TaxID=2585717 RepID=UPI0011161A68|nr:endo-alpha-N-acetylgalactosaminidase family protein [Agromyces laixinhei]
MTAKHWEPRISSPGFIDRFGKIGLAGVLAAGALIPISAVPASAAPASAAPASAAPASAAPASAAPASAEQTGAAASAPDGQIMLVSRDLEVAVSADFPQVVGYTDRDSDATLRGNPDVLTSLTINGADEPVTVTSKRAGRATAAYVITPSNLEGVVIEARLRAKHNVVTFEVTKITDPGAIVTSLQIPGQNLVTVSSADAGASVAAANLSVNRNVSGDAFIPVTPETPLDAEPQASNAIIANTSQLAAAFATNALYDTSSGVANKDAGNFFRQAVSDGAGGVEVGVSSGQWLVRADRATTTEELPWVKVAITPDANDDGTVDWQDGAIAMRDIRVAPFKGDQTPDNVVTHIPFNFASQATHPFLRTLDDVKRVSLATDGLGQVAMLKGYTSEGHDSANTDFGDNFNERAGGLDDLNTLAKQGEKWNASFGVHVNATEIYPEAKSFSDALANEDSKGWNWLDQSYYMDQREDIVSGTLDERIGELADATHKNLDFVYVDVYYQYGWLAQKIQDSLTDHGFRVGSEWADKLSENNTWSHWANDENYGGSDNKGINSQILRFVNNTQADVWNPDPKLGAPHLVEFEGWTNQNDFTAFLQNVWVSNLPAKFLQHEEIMRWTPEQIDLTGGVSVTGATAAERNITVDGASVLQGGTYLLPWSSKEGKKVDKLYHYNPDGGATTWSLTDDFAKNRTLSLYALTDTGREKVADVPVVDGQVTIEADAAQAYVLAAGKSPSSGSDLPKKAEFGDGTGIDDPGFSGGTLDAWNPTGGATAGRDDLGRRSATLGTEASSISQKLDRLKPGTYSVSAWVEVEPGRTRPTTLSVELPKGDSQSVTIDSSGAENFVAADEMHGTGMQRLRVLIDVPRGGAKPTLTIGAEAGEASVRIDDVRVVETSRLDLPEGAIYAEDFEDVDQGWGPFVKGDAGGSTDPRTHISERNEPFTQKGWNDRPIDMVLGGDWSLMAHEENSAPGGGPGMVYRTSEYTIPFEPGHQYRVSFDYQSSKAGEYAWVAGYDGATDPVVTSSEPIGEATETTRFEQTVDASFCGDTFVGLQRIGSADGADVILDDLLVEDLGESDAVPACAQLNGDLTPDVIEQGVPAEFVTTFTSDEPADIADVAVTLDVPEGWTAEATDAATAAGLAPGASLVTHWNVVAPASADGEFAFTANASYTTTTEPVGERSISTEVDVRTLPTAPQADVFASDHPWVSATNGWGPVERDQSNGEQGEGDGTPITLDGVAYEKGLGTHAPSTVRYYTGGFCTAFTAQVGVDDAQATRGSVQFSVIADGRTIVTTPVLGATSATVPINADISGALYVDLVVGTTPDGNGNDHADWADAKFACSDEPTEPTGPVAPAGTVFVSDLPFVSSTNGWGPVERDLSNGENAAGDGFPLTVGGTVFDKGLGTHADSSVTVLAGGACSAFTATVGLDDSHDAKQNGDVIFIVKGDGVELTRTDVIGWNDPGVALDVDVSGVELLELVVDRNADDAGDDHADWGDATLVCAS